MKIINDTMTLDEFQAWSGATDTKSEIIAAGKDQEFEQLIEELYPDGLTDTALNDILWHDSEWVYEQLNIEEE